MHDGLKQRLIGAVVLLALAVIFVPVIFDRQQLPPVDRETQIPPAPEINAVQIPEPPVPEVQHPAPPVEDIFLPEQPAEDAAQAVPAEPSQLNQRTRPDQAPQLNEQGVPQAWVIQVASFRGADRAEELKEALAEAGYRVYTRAVDAGQGTMTRVFVGPKVDRGRLLEDQKAIEEKFKLSTVVLKFEP